MSTEPTANVEPQDQESPTSLTVVKPTRKRKAPVPTRTLEELHGISPKSMTEAEMRKYIDEMRDIAANQYSTIEELKRNCESAYEQNRQKDQRFSEFKMKAVAKFQYARNAIQTLHMGVGLLGSLED